MSRRDISPGTKRPAPSTISSAGISTKRRNVLPKNIAPNTSVAGLRTSGAASDHNTAITGGSNSTGRIDQHLVSPSTTNANSLGGVAGSSVTAATLPASLLEPLAALRRRTIPAIAPSASVRPPPPTVKNVPNFLNKLYGMVNDVSSNHLIHWSDTGASFIVTRHEDFAREVLPRFFKHGNFSSFVRQLNMYGFHKVPHIQQGVLAADSEDAEQWEFTNSNFRRDQPDLLYLVQRKRGRTLSEMQAASNGDAGIEVEGGGSVNTSSNTISNRGIDIHQLLQELTAVKKHQIAISEDLREIQYENRQLWSEAIAARDRHERQQDTIDNILRFLASVFTSEKRRRGIYPRGGSRRQLLLGDRNTQYSDDETDFDTFDGLQEPGAEASAILDEFTRQRRNRPAMNRGASLRRMSSVQPSESIMNDIDNINNTDLFLGQNSLPMNQPATTTLDDPALPLTTNDYSNPNNAITNNGLFSSQLTDSQLKLLNQWLLANMATTLPTAQDTLNQTLLQSTPVTSAEATKISTIPTPTSTIMDNSINSTQTSPDQASMLGDTSPLLASLAANHSTANILPHSTDNSPLLELLSGIPNTASTGVDPTAMNQALTTAANALTPNMNRYTKEDFSPQLVENTHRTQNINVDLNRLDDSILALVEQLGLDPMTGRPIATNNNNINTNDTQQDSSPLLNTIINAANTSNHSNNDHNHMNDNTDLNTTLNYDDDVDLSQFLQELGTADQDQLFSLLNNKPVEDSSLMTNSNTGTDITDGNST